MAIRRVVAGEDETGKAVIQFDSEAQNVSQPTSSIETTLLWVTDSAPASNAGNEDTADQVIGIPPPPNGSIFRTVEFGPEGSEGASDELEYLSTVGAEQEEGARHPGMHKTNSIDYAIILTGEIDMLVDEDEVHLKAGDVVVQRGNNHAWANRGTEPCKIAFILIDAVPLA
jgi:mannose-6-phosphate isomerase-like protein (cupin superfamily)